MTKQEKTCTISGMRPFKLPDDLDLSKLLRRLKEEIRASIRQGYTDFQTGMAMGVDIWAAKIVLRLKKEENPDLRLCCCLPCETQADEWKKAWRDEYYYILSEADEAVCLQKQYSAGCMQKRNRMMVDSSSRLIAVYDGSPAGGTAQTVAYARQQGLQIALIDPMECV